MKKQKIICWILCFTFSTLFGTPATRDMVKEAKVEKLLADIDPTVVPAFRAGTIAMDGSNYALSDSLYSLVMEKAPNFDPVLRRLGSVKVYQGQIDSGLALCEKAMNLHRSSDNILMMATSLMASGGPDAMAPVENMERALTLLHEGEDLPDADDYGYKVTIGQAALNLNKEEEFRSITKELIEKYPDEMAPHYYAALVAAADEKWVQSEEEIYKAQKLGLPAAVVHEFLNTGVHTKASVHNSTRVFIWVLVGWLIGFALLYIIGLMLSNYTLRSVEREFQTDSIFKTSQFIKRIYSFLINIAGIYYYISLPIIIVLVILVVIGLFYLTLSIGFIPIKLMIILLIGAVVSVYAMIRSLFVKINYDDPGRKLNESEAPGLYRLINEVAHTMGTKPIAEIRITPETDLAVYEKGSWKEKLRDDGQRMLILGTGVLKDFKQSEFRAIIAHEYGHFSNRDTAGGAVAMRVRGDMHKYIYALHIAGQNVWWNLSFLFLIMYTFIFRRISNGATRLQEILADRIAAQTYGKREFENGLTYVIRRNVEFMKLATVEIEEAKKIKRSFNNIYELTDSHDRDIDEEVQKHLTRPTTLDDTHPSPTDRFRYIQNISVEKHVGDSSYVRDLFTDWNGITKEMTSLVEASWNG